MRGAVQRGVSLGLACLLSCANLVVVLLAMGLMNLKAMLLLTAAGAIERSRFAPPFVARGIGIVIMVIGTSMIAHEFGTPTAGI
jgi:predicted metal-binding membrane protein